jgi:cell fate regulator YaaT (PSP1 superfamily)
VSDDLEYLLRYGQQGDFGRFRPVRPLACRRGDRAVVRSPRGLEIAEVLRAAAPGHAVFLPNTTVGQLLRLVTPEDERAAARRLEQGRHLFDRATRLAAATGLPLEVIDAEILLDGEHAVLHHLRWEACDVRPFVSTLSREFELQLALADLTRTRDAPAAAEEAGCGRCGSAGGCGSCGSQDGCGSCSSASPQEVQAYFAGLREQMERRRTSLL